MADFTLDDMPDTLCRVHSAGAWDGSASLALARPSLSGITPRSGGSVYQRGPDTILEFIVYDSGTDTFSTNTVTVPSLERVYGGTLGAEQPPDLCRIVDLSSVGLGTRAIIWHAGTVGVYAAAPPGWATANGLWRPPLTCNDDTTLLNGGALFVPDDGADGDGAIIPYPVFGSRSLHIWGGALWGSVSGSLPLAASSGTLKVYKIVYDGGVANRTLCASYSMDIADPTTWTHTVESPSWLGAGDYYDDIICEQTTHWPSAPDDVTGATISWEDFGSQPYPYNVSRWVEAGYGDAYSGSVADDWLTFDSPTCELPTVEIADYDYGPRPPFYPPFLPWPPAVTPALTITVPASPTLDGRIPKTSELSGTYENVTFHMAVYVAASMTPILTDSYNLDGTTTSDHVLQYIIPGTGQIVVHAYYSFGTGDGYLAFYGRNHATVLTLP